MPRSYPVCRPQRLLTPVLLSVLAACGLDAPAPTASSSASLVVTTVSAQTRDIVRELVASGSVAAWQEMSLGVELSGIRAAEVLVEVGDVVESDQTLLRLDSRTLQVQARQAEASLAQARAGLELARANANRAESLVEQGLVSTSELDQLRADLLSAKAQLTTAQANLEEARLRLSFATLKAPDAGVISARAVQPGQVVSAGNELLRLIRQGRLEWRAELAERDLTRVQKGAKLILTAPSGESVKGVVRNVSPAVDPESRNGLLYADLAEPGALRAGMFAQGRILLGEAATQVLPRESVVFRDGFPYVFVVSPLADDKDGLLQVERRRIGTGIRQGNLVEVLSGLMDGERVVRRGAGFLSDGDIVREATNTEDAVTAR